MRSALNVGKQTVFERAIFHRPLWLQGSRLGLLADFSAAQFHSNLILDGSTIDEQLKFENAQFLNKDSVAIFTSMKVGGEAEFNNARFDSDIVFQDAQISANALFMDATFGSMASFDRMRVQGNLSFKNARFISKSAEARFPGIDVKGQSNFDGTLFQGAGIFFGARLGQAARFMNSAFEGEVIFNAARVDGGAVFKGTRFSTKEGSAQFVSFDVGDQAIFEGCEFCGEAHFQGARLGRVANFDRTSFKKKAAFDAARIGEIASFLDVSFGPDSSETRFPGIIVGLESRFDGTSFGGKVTFNRSNLGQAATFRSCTFTEGLDMTRVRIPGNLLMEKVVLPRRLHFQEGRIGRLFFSPQGEPGRMDLAGRIYRWIADRSAWLRGAEVEPSVNLDGCYLGSLNKARETWRLLLRLQVGGLSESHKGLQRSFYREGDKREARQVGVFIAQRRVLSSVGKLPWWAWPFSLPLVLPVFIVVTLWLRLAVLIESVLQIPYMLIHLALTGGGYFPWLSAIWFGALTVFSGWIYSMPGALCCRASYGPSVHGIGTLARVALENSIPLKLSEPSSCSPSEASLVTVHWLKESAVFSYSDFSLLQRIIGAVLLIALGVAFQGIVRQQSQEPSEEDIE